MRYAFYHLVSTPHSTKIGKVPFASIVSRAVMSGWTLDGQLGAAAVVRDTHHSNLNFIT